MDISYLLWLQDLRNSTHNLWTPHMEAVSLFAISYLMLAPIFIYWCLDKRKGLFIIAALNIAMAFNVLAKLTACVYRPWIREPLISPAGNAIKTAHGYSFPSGHTAIGTAVYGGLSVSYWKKKGIICLCVLAALLTGFSRNYLGVHTPQDVFAGLLVGGFALWITSQLFEYVQKHPQQENKLLIGGIVFVILSIIYFSCKSYPVDYVDGKILVDPRDMINNGYSNVGGLLFFCIARFVEKRWVQFCPTGLTLKGIIFCVIGLLPIIWMIHSLFGIMISWFGPHMGRLFGQGAWVFYVVAFYPWLIKYFCSKKQNT